MASSSRDRRQASASHGRERRNSPLTAVPRPEVGPASPTATTRARRGEGRGRVVGRAPSPRVDPFATVVPLGGGVAAEAQILSLSSERREVLCSVIGLAVKLGLVAVAGVSLFRLAGAYQQRMERQSEITAVLELQSARLTRARERFDSLFMVEGEQRLIREQSQWIAPNRLRVVWQNRATSPTVETASVPGQGQRPATAATRP